MKAAVAEHPATASVIYVPAPAVKDAVLEALDAGIKVIVATSEGLPRQTAAYIVAAARATGATIVGPNTNGVISPGRSKLGGIGGVDPSANSVPGRIGLCPRSVGLTAEDRTS